METWTTIANTILSALTLFAILVGGTVGYLRYLRGRISHAKLDLDLNVELCQIKGRDALKIAASIKNDGTCRIAFPRGSKQEIQVAVCYQTPWAEACEAKRTPKWEEILPEKFGAKQVEENGIEGTPVDPKADELPELEPGQRTSRQILAPGLAEPQPVGYRVRLYAEGKPHLLFRHKKLESWSTERVIEVNR